MTVRHVILDRDGVLNEETTDGRFVGAPADWRWLPGAVQAIAHLARADVLVSVATNQAQIGRGLMTSQALDAVHAQLSDDVARAGGRIHGIYVCPHAPADECDCRKPAPGLIYAAIAAAGIRAEDTLVVGDDGRDIDAARTAGVAAALVLTGKGHGTARSRAYRDVPAFADLLALSRTLCEPHAAGKEASG